MKKRLLLVVGCIYALLVVHFVFSNAVFTLGPNIVMPDAVTEGCALISGDNLCAHSCPLYGGTELDFTTAPPQALTEPASKYYDESGMAIMPGNIKGFPFATNAAVPLCPGMTATVPDEAQLYNVLYIVVVSFVAVAIYVFIRAAGRPKKAKKLV